MEERLVKKLIYLVWFAFPLTKIVYVFVGLKGISSFSNIFIPMNFVFIGLGICICLLSLLLSGKIHTSKEFYRSKLTKLISSGFQGQDKNSKETMFFYFFIMGLGLCEAASVFGLVRFLVSSNLIFFIIMISPAFITWIFHFPRMREYEVNIEATNAP